MLPPVMQSVSPSQQREWNVMPMPTYDVILQTQGLSKAYGKRLAVDALDLEVARGEVFGFLGPNGAGKTTTIRMLLDILRPTSGTAEVLGGAPGDTAVRARIGFLPADLHLDPRHRVQDAIDFFGD